MLLNFFSVFILSISMMPFQGCSKSNSSSAASSSDYPTVSTKCGTSACVQ